MFIYPNSCSFDSSNMAIFFKGTRWLVLHIEKLKREIFKLERVPAPTPATKTERIPLKYPVSKRMLVIQTGKFGPCIYHVAETLFLSTICSTLIHHRTLYIIQSSYVLKKNVNRKVTPFPTHTNSYKVTTICPALMRRAIIITIKRPLPVSLWSGLIQ